MLMKPRRLRNVVRHVNRVAAVIHLLVALVVLLHPSKPSEFIVSVLGGYFSTQALSFLIAMAGVRWAIWPMTSSWLMLCCLPMLVLAAFNTAYLLIEETQSLWPPIVYYGCGVIVISVNWYYLLETAGGRFDVPIVPSSDTHT